MQGTVALQAALWAALAKQVYEPVVESIAQYESDAQNSP